MTRQEFKICKFCGKKYLVKSKTLYCSRSCRMKDIWTQDAYRSKQTKTRENSDYKNKMSKSIKEAYTSDELRTRMSNIMKIEWIKNRENRIETMNSEKCLTRKSEILKERWKDDSYIESMKKMSAELWKNTDYTERMKNIHNSDKYKKRMSKIVTELWKNPEYASKCLHNGFKRKDFKLPSGRIVKLQGYEPQVLEQLLQIYPEYDIIIDEREIFHNIGKISYIFNEKERRYYPDFYIKSTNTIIEVKSQWTFNLEKEKNLIKEQACLQQGFNFEFKII